MILSMYRVMMDELVLNFYQRQVKEEDFDRLENGYYLNREGKKILIEAIMHLEKKIRYRGRNIQVQNIIQHDCHEITNRY